MSTFKYGISTHLYHDERLSRDQLVEIAAHGFEWVELFANRPHIDVGDEPATAELEEALRDTGLRVHSVHAPIADSLRAGVWGDPYSIASADERVRAAGLREVEAAIGFARRVGASIVVAHVGIPDVQKPSATDNRLDAARRSLEQLREFAVEASVTVALENVPNRLSSAAALVDLIENDLESSCFGMCLDTGHAHLTGDLVDAIEAASGHVVTTHVHDNHGRSDDHLAPFDGRIDWDGALMALQKIGYDGALVFELAGSAQPRSVLERAERARARFDDILRASGL